jgi:Aerotolerance regulator N-terminal
MGFFFANPLGLLVLSGIGGIVLIHLLRRKSRRIVVSTLFLVQRARPSGEGGKRFRRLRNSLPLWAQILIVVALTWLAAQPRWIDSTSVQTVVVVFDSSASMSAFREKALEVAASELRRRESAAARTQWIFLRSDGSRMTAGAKLSDVLAEAERAWRPTLGTHDVNEALRLARTLAGEKGSIVYFTDHRLETERAFDVSWVAVGEPIDNAGLLGAGVQDGRWSALLKNFSAKTRDVRWRIAGEAEWRTQHLDPDATAEISGELPGGMDKLTLELEDDQFVLDNRLPLVRPQPKTLAIRVVENEGFRALFEQMLRIAEPLSIATDGGQDVSFEVFNPLTPRAFAGAGIVFAEDSGTPEKLLSGTLVAENHLLMESLNWQGLVARDTFGITFHDGDVPLLWQGGRALIFLRMQDKSPQLIFSFDIRQSNAVHLPAFGLLIYRFLATRRAEKVAPEAANVETRQKISVAGVGAILAPDVPDFFSVKGPDGSVLFDGASQFSDFRESDFRQAASGRIENHSVESIRQSHATGEFLDPAWLLLVAALMLWNWFLTGAPLRPPRAA